MIDQVESNLARKIKRRILYICLALSFAVLFVLTAIDQAHVLADPDTLWHIKLGQNIVRDLGPHTIESLSYTFKGQPFYEVEWLSDVIFYLAHASAGWAGVIMVAAFASGIVSLVLCLALAEQFKPIYAATASILLCVATYPAFLARPHIFSYPLLVFWTWRLFRSAGQDKPPEYLLLLLLALWINLHPSYALAGCVAVFAFLEVLWRNRARDLALLKKWIIFLMLCPVFLLLNPYGWHPLLVTFEFMSKSVVMKDISEWQPFTLGSWPFTDLYFFAVPALLMLARPRIPLVRASFALFSFYLFMKYFRFAFTHTLLSPIVLAPAMRERFPKLSTHFWQAEKPDDIEVAANRHFGWIIAVALALPVGSSLSVFAGQPLPPPENYVQDAIAFAKQHHLEGHVLNEHDFGGALIFNDVPTFVDGRSDQIFLGKFWTDLHASRLPGGEQVFEKILTDYDIAWSLLKPDDVRNLFFSKRGWQKAYEDKFAVIYVKPS